MVALISMVTKEGWIDFMINSVDSSTVGFEPVQLSNRYFEIIFIMYMLFGSLFITHLFIEVVIATFQMQRKVIDRDHHLTDF